MLASPAANASPDPSAAPSAPSSGEATASAVLAAVAEKTGYPQDALTREMDLESDLGIDSIKRVEILSAARERLPQLPELDNETLNTLRTLDDVIRTLSGPEGSAPPAENGASMSAEAVVDAMFAAVAEKTGYPQDALTREMDLESDLGIDSIKRVEILSAARERLPQLPELDNETLGAARTLDDLVDRLTAATGSPRPPPVAPFAASPPPLPREGILEALLDAVAEKTGFPRDALSLDMDLESDLGVDSIKRVEILSAARERLPQLPELDNETLGALRRLRDVGDALASVANGLGFALIGNQPDRSATPALIVPPKDGAVAPAPTPVAAPVALELPPVQSAADLIGSTAAPEPAPLQRRVVAVVPAPDRRSLEVQEGARFVVTADPGSALAEPVAAALAARGIAAEVVDPDWSGEIAAPAGDPIAGVVHLAAAQTTAAPATDLAARVRGGFAIARAVGPCERFVTVCCRGGAFGRRDGAGDPVAGALSGLSKTIAKEWPGCRPLHLDLGADVAPEAIVDEILGDRGVVEVGIAGGEAHTLADGPLAVAADPFPLQAGDLVVVSGGGRGVTAAAAIALASRGPFNVLLIGRTDPIDDPAWAKGVSDEGLVAARVAAPGDRPSPAEANADAAHVRASREIRATIARLAEAGSAATYAAIDGRDAAAVAAAVDEAQRRWGPVRGVVCGAGVLADKRLVDKTDAAFEAVWSTKVRGMEALLGAVDLDALRVCCAFTSVAGRYGNAGQCDYAMANEALVQRLLALQQAHPALRVKAIDWGPWDGGMVTPSLKAHFEARGHTLIGLGAGAEAFVRELADPAPEVVIEGALPRNGTAVRTIAPEAPWLRDHRIAARPVVPAAMVVEWLADLAQGLAPGRAGVAVRDVEVLKGIVVEDRRDLTLSWAPVPGEGRSIAVAIEGAPSGSAAAVRHYRGVIDLDGPAPPEAPPEANGLAADPFPDTVAEVYGAQLFHGPAFRVIDEIVGISEAGAVAWIRTSAPAALGVAAPRWRTDPAVIDAALQLVLIWVQHKRGSGALPTALGAIRWYGDDGGTPRARLQCRLRMEEATASNGRFSALFVDDADRVVASLSGGRYDADPSLLDKIRATPR